MAVLVCLLLAGAAPFAQAQAPGTLTRYDNWMDQLFTEKPSAMDQSLARFIFPGTHDSGAYDLQPYFACEGCYTEAFTEAEEICSTSASVPNPYAFICSTFIQPNIVGLTKPWADAQHLGIRGQLNAGARYLDLRFFRADASDQIRTGGRLQSGRFYAYHGLVGPDSAVVLNDIVAFLEQAGHDREVLILEISGLRESDGEMTADSKLLLLDQFRTALGSYMAPRQRDDCQGDPACAATARLGGGATVRDLLDQEDQVIVTCDCGRYFWAEDIWSLIDSRSPYSVEESHDWGYPSPEDPTYPWISDKQIFDLLQRISTDRDLRPQDRMFNLGVQVGIDNSLKAMFRAIICLLDPAGALPLCPAVNHDWDRFQSLREVAEYTNPKALSALVGLRRDRVNIVAGDHYSTAFTEEIYKLNRGATRVELRIDSVAELSDHDTGSNPDFYPVFTFPGVAPFAWEARVERNIQVPNDALVDVGWPAWKAYPNDWGTATVGFAIYDADSGAAGDDDRSNISVAPSPTTKFTAVPITACVHDVTQCLFLPDQLYTRGFGPRSSEVYYKFGTCVWSWLPTDSLDPDSLCGGGPGPVISVQDVRRNEGQSGFSSFDFAVTLSTPSPVQVTVHYYTSDHTALAGTDYTAAPLTMLTFAPGETSRTVTVPVRGDAVVEPDETFSLKLVDAMGATIGDDFAEGTILNDDVFRLSIAMAGRVEGNSGTTPLDFDVTLDRPSGSRITVRYATADGTARAGSDYVAVPDTLLTFAEGETVKTIRVQVNGDLVVEGLETFFVNLHTATNATIDVATATGSIFNDDVANPEPVLDSLILSDETGTPLGDTMFALTGFPIALEGTVIGAGPLDAHRATIAWGDRSSGAVTLAERNGIGVVRAQHTWNYAGTYTVRVSIVAGSGGTGSRQTTVKVIDGLGAVCSAHLPVVSLTTDPSLEPQTRQDLTRLLGRLRGKLAGSAPTGACDLFFKGDVRAGVARLVEAVAAFEALAGSEDALSAAQAGVLRQVAAQLALAAKWCYVKLATRIHPSVRPAEAAILAQRAETAMAAQTYDVAAALWNDAVRALAPR